MAPAGPAAALVGPGPGEVRTLLAWDSSEAAALLTEAAPLPDPLASLLAACDAALVFSRAAELAARLERFIERVVVHHPRPPAGGVHAAAWYASALARLDVPPPPGHPPPIVPTPHEAAAADAYVQALPTGFLAIHPGSGSSAKNAPPERLAALLAREPPGRPFALVEGPADEAAAARVRAFAPAAVSLRALPLRVLGAVLSRCGLFVGNDSGVSHLAAAYGARCHLFFGPTDPAVWSPPGPHVTTERFDPVPARTCVPPTRPRGLRRLPKGPPRGGSAW